MASWMIHLRVAEKVMQLLQVPDEERFVLGNMAPDSGVPVEGGYEPSAAVSHFRTIDENGVKAVHEELYVQQYLTSAQWRDYTLRAQAFHLGYLSHLITDRLWSKNVVYPAKAQFETLFQEDNAAFWRMVKRDWYDMDFLFLRAHPDFQAWQTYCDMTDMRNDYVEFFSQTAFADRRAWIMDFFREGAAAVQEREMYLSWAALDAFVEDAAREIVRALSDINA